MTYAPINTESPFLPVTFDYPSTPEELQNRFPKIYSDISSRLNTREIAFYPLQEILTGQQWFGSGNPQIFRPHYRMVFSIGAIAKGTTYSAAHGITGYSTLTFTMIRGTAITSAATFNQVPLPYVQDTSASNDIQIDADTTNFEIVVGSGAPNLTSAIVILEYLKN